MNQIAAQPQFEFVLSILSGKDKGAVYKMISPRIRIGRADDNDICLTNDPKISRYHASITVSAKGVEIRDISDKNKLLVDGSSHDRTLIVPGSVFKLGDTEIKFDIDRPIAAMSRPNANNNMSSATAPKKKSSRKAGVDQGKIRFYIIVGALLAGFFYLMSSDQAKVREPASLKTSETSLNQIDANRESVRESQDSKRKKGHDTDEYKTAESLYIQGFRDYQKGQYESARLKFQSCLAIFPQHELCNNYFREADKKLSELIQYYLNLGYEYQSKNQFKSCLSAFNNVMYLQKDKNSTIFREADAGREACIEALK